jgi:hypothetical protein
MKKTTTTMITIVATLVLVLVGTHLWGQNKAPTDSTKTVSRQEVQTQKEKETRQQILSAIPNDQLIIVSKWGDGYVDGYDLTGKFWHITEPVGLPKVDFSKRGGVYQIFGHI